MSSTLSGLAGRKTTIADHDIMYLDFDTSGTGAGPYTDEGIVGSDIKTLMAAQAPVQSVAGRTGAVVLAHGDVSGLAASATTDTTNAANIASGTLPDVRLSNVITAAGPIGDATHVPQITFDAHGRLTAVSSVAITGGAVSSVAGRTGAVTLAAADVSGLAASATTDATNASNLSSGTLPAGRLPTASTSAFGGVKDVAPASHKWVVSINGGVPALSQPVVADVTGAAPLASPTFTGSVTMPDGATWGSAGISTSTSVVMENDTNAGYYPFSATNTNTSSSAVVQFSFNNASGSVAFGLTGHNWTPGVFGLQPDQMFFNNPIVGGSFAIGVRGAGGSGVAALYADQYGQVVVSPGFTVATLPAGVLGARAFVTDATSPTFLGALTGGGSVKCPVFFNGSAWVAG